MPSRPWNKPPRRVIAMCVLAITLIAGGCMPVAAPDQDSRVDRAPHSVGQPDVRACEHPRAVTDGCQPWAQPEQRPLATVLPYVSQLSEHGAQWGAVYACDALAGARLASMMTDGLVGDSAYLTVTHGIQCSVFATSHPAYPRLEVMLGRGPWALSPQEVQQGGSCWSCPNPGIPDSTAEVVEIGGREVAFQTVPLAEEFAKVDMRIRIPHLGQGDWVWLVEYRTREYWDPEERKHARLKDVPPDRARVRKLAEELVPVLIAYDQRT